MTTLRRIAEHLLVALVAGLPFEYYFASRDQTLESSLKLQLGLLVLVWVALRGASPARALRDVALAVPRRLLMAVGLFVLLTAAAAALAREERGNAARAAAKTALGAVVLLAAADLTRGALDGRDERTIEERGHNGAEDRSEEPGKRYIDHADPPSFRRQIRVLQDAGDDRHHGE